MCAACLFCITANVIYELNFSIPRDKYDATIGPYKREVLFQNIALIEHLLLKSIEKFAKKYKLPKVNTTLTDILTNKEDVRYAIVLHINA